jgi:uncharacterized protein YggU (UPF0235/DUF167 family)
VRLTVRVQPRSSREGVELLPDGELRVRVTAAPVEGAANEAVITILARLLRLPRGALRLTGGATSRHKLIDVAGVSPRDVRQRLTREEKR